MSVEFENKCDVFIEVMYSESSNIKNTNDETKTRLNLNLDSFK